MLQRVQREAALPKLKYSVLRRSVLAAMKRLEPGVALYRRLSASLPLWPAGNSRHDNLRGTMSAYKLGPAAAGWPIKFDK